MEMEIGVILIEAVGGVSDDDHEFGGFVDVDIDVVFLRLS